MRRRRKALRSVATGVCRVRARMSDVVGIRYVTAGPIDYCGPGDLQPGLGDYVVVEKEGAEQLGWVVLTPDQVISATIERPFRNARGYV